MNPLFKALNWEEKKVDDKEGYLLYFPLIDELAILDDDGGLEFGENEIAHNYDVLQEYEIIGEF